MNDRSGSPKMLVWKILVALVVLVLVGSSTVLAQNDLLETYLQQQLKMRQTGTGSGTTLPLGGTDRSGLPADTQQRQDIIRFNRTGDQRMGLPSEIKEPPSIIEKAYRLQYSEVLLEQLQGLDEKKLQVLDEATFKQLEDLQTLDARQLQMMEQRQNMETKSIKTIEPVPDTPVAPKMTGEYGDAERPGRPVILDVPPPVTETAAAELFMDRFTKPSPTLVEDQLTQFGYELFRSPAFQPSTGGQVVPDHYIIGPGDVLRVNLWGAGADVQFEGMVQADGTVALPKLGVVPLSGVRYRDLEAVMAAEAEKYVQGVNVSVSMVKPRSIEVYVVGQVDAPGLALVPAFSTALNALTLAGGPLKTGSLRSIAIYRGGELYRQLDLYDLIFSGNTENDVFLQDKDVVHVPYIGPTVAVVGAVRRPAIYEIKNKNVNVGSALNTAGGAVAQAMAKIYVRRFQDNRALTVLDVNLDSLQTAKVSVRDGDLVEVRFAGQSFPTAIRVTGHIWDQVDHRYEPGLKLSQVAPRPKDLKPDALTDFGLIRRYMPEKAEYNWIRFPLTEVWAGKYDVEMQPHDLIRVLSRDQFGITRKVFLRGAVWQPADYEYSEGLTLKDLVAMGGGFKDGANLRDVEISRQKIVNFETVTEHVRVDITNESKDYRLEPYDSIMVPLVKDVGLVRQVTIKGEVRFPGNYAIKTTERLSDLISRAGGFLPTAYLYGATYTSPSAMKIQQVSIDRMISDLEVRMAGSTVGSATSLTANPDAPAELAAQKAFIDRLRSIKAAGRVAIVMADLESFRGSKYDFEIQDGDLLEVPTKPSFINVVGSVYSPNSYLYQPEATISDYLRLAGGPTKTSDESYIYVQKANGQVLSVNQSGIFKGFYNQTLMPGDTIVVPEDLERLPTLQIFKDITDVVYKIAITGGVAAAVF
jgi:protein involved in polysaccharide export with SLBB domain